jgi:hypothetical protein
MRTSGLMVKAHIITIIIIIIIIASPNHDRTTLTSSGRPK